MLAAVWSIESNLGRFSGVRPTIQALATLAWDGRRAAFFRGELLDALTILDRGDIEPARLKGSWAGALGQPQFMPSTYLRYAQDFDGDGRRDIWRSLPDVFASIANFLKENGWNGGRRPGAARSGCPRRPVRDHPGRAAARGRLSRLSRDVGAAPAGALVRARRPHGTGTRAPRGDRIASLVTAGSRSFLVYRNYEALLAYNCAHVYALSVGLLGDRLTVKLEARDWRRATGEGRAAGRGSRRRSGRRVRRARRLREVTRATPGLEAAAPEALLGDAQPSPGEEPVEGRHEVLSELPRAFGAGYQVVCDRRQHFETFRQAYQVVRFRRR